MTTNFLQSQEHRNDLVLTGSNSL